MLRDKKLMVLLAGIMVCSDFICPLGYSQHPNMNKMDSLNRLLPLTHGIQRVDCLNALGEEMWWPSKLKPDSIALLAKEARDAAIKLNYREGLATSIMLSGVAEIYRKNFFKAEKYLLDALAIYESIRSDFGLGWCDIWLGQAQYSQNEFDESLSSYFKSIPYLDKTGDWEGKGKAWVWMAFVYGNLGNYDSSFYFCTKSLLLRQKMSDHVCVSVSLTNMGQLYKAAGSFNDALDYYRQGYNYANAHGVDFFTTNWAYLEPVGAIFRIMNLTDSSYQYLQRARQLDPNNEITHISYGETLLMKNQLDSALIIFLQPIEKFRKGNDRWDLMRVTLDVAKTYNLKKQESKALPYAFESYDLAVKSKAKQFILENYSILSKIYKALNLSDSCILISQPVYGAERLNAK